LNGDGVQDIAVGENLNGDGGPATGAVWILFLNTNGSVKSEYKINESRFGNGSELTGDEFGISIANLGDLDGDGVHDIAVGEYLNDNGGAANGAVWILFLNTSGGVNSEYKINESRFGNGDELNSDRFGGSVANLGDLDGDGLQDIVVGEYFNDDGGTQNGAVWILFLSDDIPPDLEFVSPTPYSGDLVYEDILVNISFSGADNATVYLSNSSKNIINTTTSTTSPLFLNYTNIN